MVRRSMATVQMHHALRTVRATIVGRSMSTEGLGFKDFIRRAQVKAQYREMLRLARRYARARPADGADVLRQVRDGYQRHASFRELFEQAPTSCGIGLRAYSHGVVLSKKDFNAVWGALPRRPIREPGYTR